MDRQRTLLVPQPTTAMTDAPTPHAASGPPSGLSFPDRPCRPPFHPDEVLDAWFGPRDDPRRQSLRREWFQGGPAFDEALRRRFLPLWEAAARGELAHWQATPQGRLALVIALDQFTRNFFRGQARAFACDATARRIAEAALADGEDRVFAPVARAFLYLPFEHSEDAADQARSEALFAALADAAPALAGYLDYARRHRAVILRFGRFPHRNAALGRATTAEEAAFLAEHPAGF